MKVKKKWTDLDFEEMGWHDSIIYSISFPNNDQRLSLDIDYIFKWVLDQETNLYKFWVSPCQLIFESVMYLKIDIDFSNSIGIYISDIKRKNPQLSPNGKNILWDYLILTDKGQISFQALGYNQIVNEQPVFINSQTIERG